MSTTLEQERARLAAINELLKTVASSLDLRQVYDTFVSQLKRLVAFDRASVTLIEGDKLKWFAIASEVETGLDDRGEVPLEGTAIQWVAVNKKVHYAPDLAQERQFWTEDILYGAGIRSIIRIPLFSKGEVIGVFSVSSRQPNAYGEEEREILEEVAGLLAVAVENGRLFDQARAMVEKLKASEAKYRGLVEDINDGYLVSSATGKILFANAKMAQILGYKLKELIGEDSAKLYPPEFASYIERLSRRVGQRRPVRERMEAIILNRDGELVPIELSRKVIDYEGQPALAVIVRDITERKRGEEALRASEERLRDFFDNANDLIQSVAPDGRLLYVNRTWRETLRYTEEEIAGLSLFDIIHPDSLAHCMEVFQRVMAGEKVDHVEAKFVTKDGRTIMVEGSANCRFEDGKPVATRGIFRNITERKQAEEALRESGEKYRLLFENAGASITYFDTEGKLVLLNRQGIKNLGAKAKGIIGKSIYDIFPEVADFHMQRFTKIMNEGKGAEFEDSFELPAGKVWFSSNIQPVKDKNGNVVGVQIISNDITERRRAEEALRESEEKLRNLFESVTDGIFAIDLNGVYTEVNKRFLEMHGFGSRDELLGKSGFTLVTHRDVEKVTADMQKVIEQGSVARQEYTALKADGSEFPVEVSGAVLKDASGNPVGFIGITRDITERRRAEEELRKFKAISDRAGYGAAISTPDGNLIYVNESFAGMHGYTVEELIGKNLSIFHTEEQMKLVERLNNQLIQTGSFVAEEVWHKRKDGTVFPALMTGTAITDDKGKPLFLSATAIDITERKRAEESIRLYQDIVNNTQIGLSVYHLENIDDEGTLRLVATNPAAGQITGVTEGNIGVTIAEFSPGLLETPFPKLLAKVVRSGKSRDLGEARYGDERVAEAVFAVKAFPLPNNHVGVAFEDVTERRQVEEALLRHAKWEEALHAIAAAVSQTLDQDQLLNGALEKVIEVMGADTGAVYLLDVEQKALVLKASRGVPEEVSRLASTIKLNEEIIENVLQWKDPNVPFRQVFGETPPRKMVEAIERTQAQSYAVVPFAVKGQLHGLIAVGSRTPREFTPDEIDLLTAIGSQIAVGIENARLFAEVSHSATVDGLTGLYNHRYFQERLEEEIARLDRFGGECSLLMLDLDHFKIYNDLFGHVAGDEVLKWVGRVLRDYTRQVDIACRYGGEEFAVILPQTGPADAYGAGERLRQAVEAALSQESGAVSTPLTISLGVASCPGDGLSREELVRSADRALGEAKERGRNQTCSASDVPDVGPAEGEVSWEVAEHLEAASLNTIYALAAAVDARDHYTYGHSRNVSRYAVAMGKALDLSRRKLERLRIAALLHDIGKIGLSDSIIRKPGPLDEAEWEMMRKHSELGATIISHSPELANCAPAIRHHHEWYEGNGYPDGLRGEDIPLEARIIAVADAYDTMTTPRAYRETLSPQEAFEELERCASTQFDPLLVETLAQVVDVAVASRP